MLTKKSPFARVVNVARQHSPLAQSVEQRTVNPPVDGSNPSGGAKRPRMNSWVLFFGMKKAPERGQIIN